MFSLWEPADAFRHHPNIRATTIPIGGVRHTHSGPEECDDHGRTVVLRGDRTAKLRAGKPVKVRGVLRVVRRAEGVVNGVTVPEWYEIRVEEQ